MSGPPFAITVTSVRGRCGKTLLARVLAEYFFLSGEAPYLFDTDTDERPLQALFPHLTLAVDLLQVRHQMALFDTLAKASAVIRIVDLSHRSLKLYFELMRNTDVIAEGRARGIEPIIFFIPDRRTDSRPGRGCGTALPMRASSWSMIGVLASPEAVCTSTRRFGPWRGTACG